MRHGFWLTLLGICGCVSGCGSNPEPDAGATEADPASLFYALEDRLLEAERVEAEFHITAEGAVEVDLEGRLAVSPDGSVSLAAEGTFAGQPVEVFVSQHGPEYEFGNTSDRTSAPAPEYLKEALLIGLTRMGILHNLAMLTAGAPPDRAGGGVTDWVTVDQFSFFDAEEGPSGLEGVSFELTVAGVPSGSAELDISEGGILVQRRQTVLFPDGEMRVVERFTSFLVDP
jgi:hypothetical protein